MGNCNLCNKQFDGKQITPAIQITKSIEYKEFEY